MKLSTKTPHGVEWKVLDDDQGIVEMFPAVTGIVDEVKDVIVPGAANKSLAMREPLGARNHDLARTCAIPLEARELMPGDSTLPASTADGKPWPREAGAFYVKAQYNLEVPDGRHAFSNVKFFGPRQQWSIGYDVPRTGARYDAKSGVRYINELNWWEFSDVPWGANQFTTTLGTKSLVQTASPPFEVKMLDGLYEVKVLPGSYEATIQAIEQAARHALLHVEPAGSYDGHVSVKGTWDDRAVVCLYSGIDDRQEWQYKYVLNGDGTATLSDRQPVTITEVLMPDAEPSDRPDYPEEVKAETAYLSPVELLQSEYLRMFT